MPKHSFPRLLNILLLIALALPGSALAQVAPGVSQSRSDTPSPASSSAPLPNPDLKAAPSLGASDTITYYVYLPLVLNNAGLPSVPVLSNISNPDGDGNYTISWSTVAGATSYTLEEGDNGAFSSPTTLYSGSDSSKSITGKGVGTYYYRVKAVNTFGSSNWSGVKSVTVNVSSPCPQTGEWSGTTNYGDPITFTVSTAPICQVEPLTITMLVFCPGFPGYRWTTVTWSVPFPISDNQFSTGSPRPYWPQVVGNFTSTTTVTGTWLYEDLFSSCLNHGTWTANP